MRATGGCASRPAAGCSQSSTAAQQSCAAPARCTTRCCSCPICYISWQAPWPPWPRYRRSERSASLCPAAASKQAAEAAARQRAGGRRQVAGGGCSSLLCCSRAPTTLNAVPSAAIKRLPAAGLFEKLQKPASTPARHCRAASAARRMLVDVRCSRRSLN